MGGEESAGGRKVGGHVYFPRQRESSSSPSAQAVLHSNSIVRLAGLPEDEKVKMLGNMPAKERRTVLVRDRPIIFLGTLGHPGLWVMPS